MKKSIFAAIALSFLVSNLYATTCPAFKDVLVKGQWKIPAGWLNGGWAPPISVARVMLAQAALEGDGGTGVPDLGQADCMYQTFDKNNNLTGSLLLFLRVPLNGGALVPLNSKNGYWTYSKSENVWACVNATPPYSDGITDLNLCAFDVG